ncbi:hypothetical protein AB0127_26920, partial [Klebsiella pneumoniae]
GPAARPLGQRLRDGERQHEHHARTEARTDEQVLESFEHHDSLVKQDRLDMSAESTIPWSAGLT